MVEGITPVPGIEREAYIFTHNVSGNSVAQWVHDFTDNERGRKRRRKNQVYLYHTILSWHKEDRPYLTREVLHDLTRQYIYQHNPFGLYVATIHTDTDHPHVHVCGSAIAAGTGKSLRMSKEGFRELKKKLREYQLERYPDLSNSYVRQKGKVSQSKMVQLVLGM